ncbi:MAG: hypothetical protein GC160_01880 [Acidobacteria bacterium]|nr:hypothetical protein [Acidobacteriota bacterium]
MNSIQSSSSQPMQPSRRPGGTAMKLGLAGVAIMALAFNIYLISKVNYVEGKAESQRESLEMEISALQERLAVQHSKQQQTLAELRASIDDTSRNAYSQARNESQKRATDVAKVVAAKQKEQQDMFLQEIGGVKDKAATNAQGLEVVRGEVAGVSTKIDDTRRDLMETEDVLLHTQDQLLGVNTRMDEHASDIARLRDQNERAVTPFQLDKSKERTRVDDVHIRLKSVDVGKNRYTVEILADDKVIVQKDKYLNEPVEFYVTGADRPYEIVVTGIEKDKVSGHLSKPKFAALARR